MNVKEIICTGCARILGKIYASEFIGKLTGNADTATKLATARTIDGISFNGSAAIIHFGTCSTAAATAAKTVSLTSFSLVSGAMVFVKFTVSNTANSPTLNVNSTGAKSIMYRGSAISASFLRANGVYAFIYDGTNWNFVGDLNVDTNTTYSAATSSDLGLVKIGSNITNSSGTISLTKANITSALGYTPPETAGSSYTHPSYTAKSSGLYKITVDNTGHVNSTSAVTKTDITALGIPSSDTVYTHPSSGVAAGTYQTVTVDADGHVTGGTNQIMQTNSVTASNFRLLLSGGANDTTQGSVVNKSANFTANPWTGGFYAKGFMRRNIGGETVDINDYNLADGSSDATFFIVKTSGGAANITNIPVTNAPFILDVILIRRSSETDYITMQKFISVNQKNKEYVRYCTNGTWTDWDDRVFTDTTYNAATTSANGLMTSTDKTKVNATNIAYGTCSTAAATAAKVVTISGNTNWTLTTGSLVTVFFSYTNSASNPTLNVNGTGAKSIWYNTSLITTSALSCAGTANRVINFIYDGTQYVFIGWSVDNNSTYSIATSSSNGLVPKFDAADGTIDSSDTDWVLTNNNGSIGWYKLPANAFNNTTYNAATTSANGLMTSTDKTKLNATNIAYGTCTTAAATAAKVVTISGNTNWTLTTGSLVTVFFSYTNSASNPTLNVNGTGAKSIKIGSTTIETTHLSYAAFSNRAITFMYDGSSYQFVSWSTDNNTTYTNASLGQGYGTCSTAEATTAKLVTLSNYSCTTGGIVAVKFTYAVPANSTMNINSKGAKAIYYRGTAITSNVIEAGDVATFIYNGSQYHLLTVDSNTGYVPLSGGTMNGVLTAQSNTSYTTAQVRNVTMSTEAASGGSNGQIHYQYV